MLRRGKVATPETADAFALPASVPPPGLSRMSSRTFPVNVGIMVPCASTAVTRRDGVIVAPAVVVVGCVVKTRRVAGGDGQSTANVSVVVWLAATVTVREAPPLTLQFDAT